MSGMFIQALLVVLVPMAVLLPTGFLAIFRTPGPRLRSALQHFAAGVVFEAAAVGVLPEIRQTHSPWPVIIGFVLGTGLVLVLGQLSRRTEQQGKIGAVLLLTVVGIDVLIDGVLIGIGFVGGAKVGVLLALALTTEFLFVGLTTAATLASSGLPSGRVLLGNGVLALLVLVGAAGGAAVLSHVPISWQIGVLSFGVAALLYLVTEELGVWQGFVPSSLSERTRQKSRQPLQRSASTTAKTDATQWSTVAGRTQSMMIGRLGGKHAAMLTLRPE